MARKMSGKAVLRFIKYMAQFQGLYVRFLCWFDSEEELILWAESMNFKSISDVVDYVEG